MSKMSRTITVIGAGNLGANIAYFLSEQAIGNRICLYDNNEGRAQGKVLDMIEAQPIRRALAEMRGCDALEALEDAKITIIALTSDMFINIDDKEEQKAALLREAEQVATHLRGYDGIVVVAAHYEAEVLRLIQDSATLDATRLMGVGTVAHNMYGEHLLAQQTGIDPRQIQLLVIGSADAPVLIAEETRIAAIPFARLYPEVELEKTLAPQIQRLNDDPRSNYYRAAAAAARVVGAIDYDMRRILPVASLLAMERYHAAQPFAIPTVVSAAGIDIAMPSTAERVAAYCTTVAKGRARG